MTSTLSIHLETITVLLSTGSTCLFNTQFFVYDFVKAAIPKSFPQYNSIYVFYSQDLSYASKLNYQELT